MKQPAVRSCGNGNEPWHSCKLGVVTDPEPDLAAMNDDRLLGNERKRHVKATRAQAINAVRWISSMVNELAAANLAPSADLRCPNPQIEGLAGEPANLVERRNLLQPVL